MMNRTKNILNLTTLLILILVFSGCAIQPVKSDKAVVGYQSQVYGDLISLPPPKKPIVVVVYKFKDQTGQYKPSDTVVQYSTAVTQGATSMLIKALQDAGNGKWFTVLEREGLNNLLNERKIIRQTRRQYKNGKNGGKPPALPPLLYAPIILEGGVIAYESDLVSGGFGARYFGAGAFTEFRRDAVTIYLRAVSVKRGKILHAVNTSKTILSVKLAGGIFRFISLTKLLEIEAGITTNEPPQMAVLEAIEMAVYSMVMEGVRGDLWSFQDASLGESLVEKYLQEKNQTLIAEFDEQGNIKEISKVSQTGDTDTGNEDAENGDLENKYLDNEEITPKKTKASPKAVSMKPKKQVTSEKQAMKKPKKPLPKEVAKADGEAPKMQSPVSFRSAVWDKS